MRVKPTNAVLPARLHPSDRGILRHRISPCTRSVLKAIQWRKALIKGTPQLLPPTPRTGFLQDAPAENRDGDELGPENGRSRSRPASPAPAGESQGPALRKRIAITPHQLKALTEEWEKGPYPSTLRREELAKQLGMTPRRVQIWFQNQRQKDKTLVRSKYRCRNQDTSSDSSDASSTELEVSSDDRLATRDPSQDGQRSSQTYPAELQESTRDGHTPHHLQRAPRPPASRRTPLSSSVDTGRLSHSPRQGARVFLRPRLSLPTDSAFSESFTRRRTSDATSSQSIRRYGPDNSDLSHTSRSRIRSGSFGLPFSPGPEGDRITVFHPRLRRDSAAGELGFDESPTASRDERRLPSLRHILSGSAAPERFARTVLPRIRASPESVSRPSHHRTSPTRAPSSTAIPTGDPTAMECSPVTPPPSVPGFLPPLSLG